MDLNVRLIVLPVPDLFRPDLRLRFGKRVPDGHTTDWMKPSVRKITVSRRGP